MRDLLGAARRGEALAEVVANGEASAPREVRRESPPEVLLPARAEDGIAVSRLVELELDDPVQHGRAIGRADRVPMTTR